MSTGDDFKQATDKTSYLTDKRLASLEKRITELKYSIRHVKSVETLGKVTRAVGTNLHSTIDNVSIGDICLVFDEETSIVAEVIAYEKQEAILLPYGSISGLSQRSYVKKSKERFQIAVGDYLLGKILDGLGTPIGELTEVIMEERKSYYPVMQEAPKALDRPLIQNVFSTGMKAIDMFITCGRGQRLAIFAAAGVGKTTTMGMILRGSEADVVVVALIGERGREVREFIDIELPEHIRKKTVLVVSTSDRPPSEHVKSAFVAQTVAEYFRDQGKNVLVFMDSITRFARAQREIGFAAGEPISRGGFPPSVFLSFPKLMERAGTTAKGSITAFYTVLTEGETKDDPIGEEVKSIVDGHIFLSRKIAERSQYPAINVLTSLSRIADRLVDDKHRATARKARLLLSKFEELEFLIRVGEYQKGADPLADEAVKKQGIINKFLQQGIHDIVSFDKALTDLIAIIANP